MLGRCHDDDHAECVLTAADTDPSRLISASKLLIGAQLTRSYAGVAHVHTATQMTDDDSFVSASDAVKVTDDRTSALCTDVDWTWCWLFLIITSFFLHCESKKQGTILLSKY